jgi:hypothetical protein
MGPTGNLPSGVFAANFVASPPSEDPAWYIEYNVSTTETMDLLIVAEPWPESSITDSGGESKIIPVPADQNVNGTMAVNANVYDIYLQQKTPVVGSYVQVWSQLTVPVPVTGEGDGDGLGFGAGTPTLPPGHHVWQPDRLPVGEIAGEPLKPNA